MAANKRVKAQSRRGLQSYRLALPTEAALPSGLPAPLEALLPTTPEESQAGISDKYPRLWHRLRDLGLRFQPAYSQRVAGRIIGRSVRTLRSWSKQGKIACYHCGGIATTPSPYHSARSIENCLSSLARGKA